VHRLALSFDHTGRVRGSESTRESSAERIRIIRRLHRMLVLLAALCVFSAIASADTLLPVGYVSYDVTGPPDSAQFDITNNTGANSSPFPDSTWPVATVVNLLNLSLIVTLENASVYTCPGAGCPSSPYFSLAADGQSFTGAALAISSGQEPIEAVLGGTFDTTVVTLNDGTTWSIAPNAFFDVSGVTSPTITDPTGSCKDLTKGCLNDGDFAVIYAEGHPTTVPEPSSIVFLATFCLLVLLFRSRYFRNRAKAPVSWGSSGIGPVAVLILCVLTASDSRATTEATVKLNTWTTPSAGMSGVNNVNLTASEMPNETINPNNVVITLSTTCGGTPSATTSASSVKHILGTSDRISFQVPGAIPTSRSYFVSISDNFDPIPFSSGASCSEVSVTVGANTLVVMNRNDSGVGSLRAVLATAVNGDTITFANGLTGIITLTSGELLITQNVNIDGPAATLITVNGNLTSRVFEVASGLNVTISDLTISNGNAVGQGGGILNDGSDLTLNRAIVSQNKALASGATSNGQGGGLQSSGGTLTVANSQFAGNQAVGSPSGDAFGGGIAITGGSLWLIHSTLSGNTAQGGNAQGGGIYNNSTSSLTINSSTIVLNQANGGTGGAGQGGGIYNNATPSLTINTSTIGQNQANGGAGGGQGGGIYNNATPSLTINTCTIVLNQVNGGTVGAGLGGGIYNGANAVLALTACSVTQNNAIGSPGIGGGIYNLGTFTFDSGSAITNNNASTSGNNIGP
jgi:hypothetical protein